MSYATIRVERADDERVSFFWDGDKDAQVLISHKFLAFVPLSSLPWRLRLVGRFCKGGVYERVKGEGNSD